MNVPSSQPGYVFLITVLFIGSIALLSSMSMLLLSWAWEQNGQTYADATQALEMARACIEEGLNKLRDNPLYGGGESFTFSPRTSCAILAVQGSGYTNRTLCAEGRSGPTLKRIVVEIENILPRTDLSSYKEVNATYDCSPASAPASSSGGVLSSSSSS